LYRRPRSSCTFARDDARAIIRDARRIPSPNGIEEMRQVDLGGVPQWISVRGRDKRNPILLFIHGGPASTEMPTSWLYQSPWEDFFTVVQWDQRGAGKTCGESRSQHTTIGLSLAGILHPVVRQNFCPNRSPIVRGWYRTV
jgi:hypothetical protein